MPEDAERFKERAQALSAQFSSYEVLPGVKVNGDLTLGENIADLGGLAIAYTALQKALEGKERKRIDGFTPEQRFFISWAQVWRTNAREEYLKQQVLVDPHSPARFRVNGPLSNLPEFHEAFGCKEGDKMYRKPEERVKIW
jgi:putative endopeptidase